MVVKVNQRDYEVLLPGDDERELITGNVGPCTALVGTNGKGTAFLFHVDGPCSVRGLSEVAKVVKHPGTFRIYATSNAFGWIAFFFVKWWILRELRRHGFRSPQREVFSCNPGGRLEVRVDADTGHITKTRESSKWGWGGTAYDPDESVCAWCCVGRGVLKRLGFKK